MYNEKDKEQRGKKGTTTSRLGESACMIRVFIFISSTVKLLQGFSSSTSYSSSFSTFSEEQTKHTVVRTGKRIQRSIPPAFSLSTVANVCFVRSIT